MEEKKRKKGDDVCMGVWILIIFLGVGACMMHATTMTVKMEWGGHWPGQQIPENNRNNNNNNKQMLGMTGTGHGGAHHP